MKVLVTGANGFLGSNLVRKLIERGYTVRALVRPGKDLISLEGLDLEVIRGNILDPASLIDAATGCRIVIHGAADLKLLASDPPAQKRTNLEGTRNVIRAALHGCVEKFIHIGTASSFPPGSREAPGTENSRLSPDTRRTGYYDSKLQAQRLVLRAVRSRNFPALVVNPTTMFGPFDLKLGSSSLVLAVYRGRIPFCPPGGRNVVHVQDVAAGIVSSVKKGRIGQCYIMGGRNLPYSELFGIIARVVGVSGPGIVIPAALLKAGGAAAYGFGSLFHGSARSFYNLARMACEEYYYSSEKAVRELDYTQLPLDRAVADAFQWYREHGLLNRKVKLR